MRLIDRLERTSRSLEPQMGTSPSPSSAIDVHIRRAAIGFSSGLISSVALTTTLHSLSLGIVVGVVVGALYGLAVRPARFAYAESVFTAGSLAILLWAVVSLLLLPTLAGNGPQWASDDMRVLFPNL
jgi:hypothetical protein